MHKTMMVQAGFQKAADVTTERRKNRKREDIGMKYTLSVREMFDLTALERVGEEEMGESTAKRARGEKCCRRWDETGHDTQTTLFLYKTVDSGLLFAVRDLAFRK